MCGAVLMRVCAGVLVAKGVSSQVQLSVCERRRFRWFWGALRTMLQLLANSCLQALLCAKGEVVWEAGLPMPCVSVNYFVAGVTDALAQGLMRFWCRE